MDDFSNNARPVLRLICMSIPRRFLQPFHGQLWYLSAGVWDITQSFTPKSTAWKGTEPAYASPKKPGRLVAFLRLDRFTSGWEYFADGHSFGSVGRRWSWSPSGFGSSNQPLGRAKTRTISFTVTDIPGTSPWDSCQRFCSEEAGEGRCKPKQGEVLQPQLSGWRESWN